MMTSTVFMNVHVYANLKKSLLKFFGLFLHYFHKSAFLTIRLPFATVIAKLSTQLSELHMDFCPSDPQLQESG